MTNVYTVRGDPAGEEYTPSFAAAGFRYVQLSGVPTGVKPTTGWFNALRVHSAVPNASSLRLPEMRGSTFGTPQLAVAAARDDTSLAGGQLVEHPN
eukprot:805141-Prymnesium_polylepis.2